jgi:hypothetical protein
LRRLKHKILVQRLYEDRAPSTALIKKLNATLSGREVKDTPPVKNPLGDELHDSIGPIEGLSFEVSLVPDREDEPVVDNVEQEPTPPKSHSNISKQRSRGNVHQAHNDACRDVRKLLQLDADADIVTFVVAPQNDAQGSVHGQLTAQGGCRSNSGLNAAAILQHRSTLNSIFIHNGPLSSPNVESPTSKVLGPNVCKRTLHVSPKCVGFLTNDIHMKILHGASDTARILEDTKFVRAEDE